jgi:hypothetical protein
MGRQAVEIESAVVENGSANKKKVFQLLPKGLPNGENLYINKSELLWRLILFPLPC